MKNNEPMEIADKYISRAGEVRFKQVDGKSVLLDLNSGSYYTLNELGNFIWDLLDGKRSAAQIVEAVAGSYEVDRDEAAGDVEALIHRLKEEGLVRLHDESQ